MHEVGGCELSGVSQGSTIAGRYRLEHRLRTSPDGAIWTAVDETLGRKVTVRVIRAGHPQAKEVVDAARRAALVDDPRLVQVLDVGESRGITFVVTEHLRGHPLEDYLRVGPLPADVVRRIVGESAQALDRAGRRGLHHLALSPAMIWVLPEGGIKIAGTAIEASALGRDPGDAEDAARDDTVGLVRLVYAGLTGQWPGTSPDAHSAVPAAPMNGAEVTPPARLRPSVPGDLNTLCVVTLGAGDDGPRDPAELADQLSPWVVQAPLPPPVGDVPQTDQVTVASGEESTEESTEESAQGEAGEGGQSAAPDAVQAGSPSQDSPALNSPAANSPAADKPAKNAAAVVAQDDKTVAVDDKAVAVAGKAVTDMAGADKAGADTTTTSKASSVAVDEPVAAAVIREASSAKPTAVATSARAAEVTTAKAPSTQAAGTEAVPPTARMLRPSPIPPTVPTTVRRGTSAEMSMNGSDGRLGREPSQSSEELRRRLLGLDQTRPAAAPEGVPRGQAPIGGWHGPDDERLGPFMPKTSMSRPPREQARLVLALIGALVVFGLVMAMFALRGLLPGGDSRADIRSTTRTSPTISSGPATQQGTSTARTPGTAGAVTGSGLTISAVKALDPEGDGSENSSAAGRVADGDAASEWRSERYNSAAFGGLGKKGVGLAVDLGQEQDITQVVIQHQGSGGVLELRTANSASYSDSQLVQSIPMGSSGQLTLDLSQPVTSRYVILWFTTLPRQDNGEYRLRITEIAVR